MGKHSDNILIFIYVETFTAYNMNVKLMEIYVHLASIVGVTKQAVKLFFHYGPWWTGGEGYFQKRLFRLRGPPTQTLTLYKTKICDLPYL